MTAYICFCKNGVLEPTTRLMTLTIGVCALERASVDDVDMLLFGLVSDMLGEKTK
jgi:hypothetical protein